MRHCAARARHEAARLRVVGAFYGSLGNEWQRSLLQRHPEALLNRAGLRGGAGAADADAWYYDPAHEEHRVQRARAIARRLDDAGYDGVFLDTTTEESVHPAPLAEFKARHPGADYDREFARFLASLRRELNGKLIFTNQGYRKADDYLPYADWDLTESLITWKDGVPRPWADPNDRWSSIHDLFVNLIEPARARYPRIRFARRRRLRGRAGVAALLRRPRQVTRRAHRRG